MKRITFVNVDVLVTYGTPAAIAAKNTTSTVPIVDAGMGDPVGSGIAASLAHPGGNLTGFSQGWDENMAGKWLELLQDMVPRPSTVAVIANPDTPNNPRFGEEARGDRAYAGMKLQLIEVREPRALDRAFEQAERKA